MRLHRLPCALCGLALLALLAGCKPETFAVRPSASHPQPATQSAQTVHAPTTAHNLPDDAQLLLQSCGKPQRDSVSEQHDRLHDGLVRKLTYRGHQPILIELTPSQSGAQPTSGGAHNNSLPPGTVWRFSSAHMEGQTLLTARDLDPFLPCATRALAAEY